MKANKILGDEWKPIAGEWKPGTSYEEVVKVSRDIHYAQVSIMQSLIAILQNRIEKKLIEIKKRHCEH